MTGNLLEIDDLTCGYGDLMVVREAGLRVAPASVTAVLGRNGAGKTTILRAVAGLLGVRTGTIRIDGQDVTGAPAHLRRSLGLGYVQENKRVFKRRTVEENLMLGLHGLGLRRREERERADEAYARFPVLAERRRRPAGLLSGGQQQMLAISQALAIRPRLLLLDEPSAGLAPSIVHEVLNVVRELRDRQGLGVLLVEQAVDTALGLADEVTVLDVGRVVHTGRVGEPGLRGVIEAAYLAQGGVTR